MRFVFKFNSKPACRHHKTLLEDQFNDSPFVTIKQTNAAVPTLIVETKRDGSLLDMSENRDILYLAATYHYGIKSMVMTHSKEKSK